MGSGIQRRHNHNETRLCASVSEEKGGTRHSLQVLMKFYSSTASMSHFVFISSEHPFWV